jgi:hypothetical protein
MSYTATKYFSPRPYAFPAGFENTQHLVTVRGPMVENDTSTMYSVGGIGSTSFEVTAFSAVGLVTYSALVGVPLINGQKVVVYNTASNTNDGTYIVSAITPSSSSAGTFVALPGPTAIAGSAQTSQTAEGVGQIQFGNRATINQTFTATAVTVSGGIMTVTYTTLVGPQLTPGDKVTLAAMTNAGNNGTFSLNSVTPTTSTGGSFKVSNASAVATDSGTGTGVFVCGIDVYNSSAQPVQVSVLTSKGWIYVWDATNQTVRVFTTGASSGAVLAEAALGASVVFDSTITFEALLIRSKF